LVAVLARWRSVQWQQVLTGLFAMVILLVCMASHIDLGVRHILPVYPLLVILAGAVVSRALMFVRRSPTAPSGHDSETVLAEPRPQEAAGRLRVLAILPAVLAGWVTVDSVRAHPDYMACFNEFAGAHPEKILAESDLDWGQDLHRLSQRLKVLGVQQVSIAYFGSASLERAGLPPFQGVPLDRAVPGYVAVSVRRSNIDYKKDGSYAWLKRYTPLERVGKSIDLFWIQP
jgi:hypothetical protein